MGERSKFNIEKYHSFILFFVVFAGFIFFRGFYPPVLDDTTAILVLEETGVGVAHWPERLSLVFNLNFGGLHVSGYRPISTIIASWVGGFIAIGALPFVAWTAVVGSLIGLTAVVTFALGRRLSGSAWGGLIAAVLLLGCPPFVAAGWVVYAGIQTLVPLLLGAGVLLYLDLSEGRPGRWGWRYGALAAILLFGPWVREFIAVLGPIIVAAEILRVRRPTLLAAMGVAGFLHGVFPTALVHFLFAPDLPIAPVFKLGYLSNQVAGKDPRLFKPEVAIYALQLIPPSFLALIGAALLAGRAEGRLRPADLGLRLIVVGGAAAAGAGYWATGDDAFLAAAALFVTAAPAALALRLAPLVAIWYAAAYLPFFKVFAQETHLAYMAQPLALIAAVAVVDLWRRLVAGPRVAVIGLRGALATITALLLVDQALNVVASRRVTMAMTDAAVRISRYLSVVVPAGSVLGSNVLMAQDLQLFSRGHVRYRFTFPGGDFEPAAAAAAQAGQGVYLLSGEHPYLPIKAAYHRNAYADAGAPALAPLGRLLTVRVVHPYLDPLRLFAARPFVSFLGPPDLVNDVYAGPHRSGRPFLREHYVAYDLYRVDDPAPKRPPPDASRLGDQLRLEEQRGDGRNILSYKGRYYAVPQSLGAVDGPGLEAGRYGDGVIGRRRLDLLQAALASPDAAATPEWLADLGAAAPSPVPAKGLEGFAVHPARGGFVAASTESDAGHWQGGDGRPPQWLFAPDVAELARRALAIRAPVDLSVMPWLATWDHNDISMRPAPVLADAPADPATLVGVWRFRGLEARILIDPDGTLRLVNESGIETAATLRGRRLFVPAWGLEGVISADERLIHWSNASRWRR